jgi:glycerophosphoryl diester phosphodiesterase
MKVNESTIERIVGERFGIHRGLASEDNPENSLGAIKAALDLRPFMVEFDVVLVDGAVRTSHPPQGPMDLLKDVLALFKGEKTFPKVDIKVPGISFVSIIDEVLGLISAAHLDFTLVNIGVKRGERDSNIAQMAAERHFVERAAGNKGSTGLNIDLNRYRAVGEGGNPVFFGAAVNKHVEALGNVFSVSPEIHEDDWELTAGFARRHGIDQIHFWLRGWPDVPEPKVAEETIRKALTLEERYPIKVFFDIDPRHIIGLNLPLEDIYLAG